MILLRREDALRINGLHLSPQHHADSKGKPEGRIIGDLSGQHDPGFTPLNGSAHDKDQLRAAIALKWGEIKHPTVDQPISMDGIISSYGKKILKVPSIFSITIQIIANGLLFH